MVDLMRIETALAEIVYACQVIKDKVPLSFQYITK